MRTFLTEEIKGLHEKLIYFTFAYAMIVLRYQSSGSRRRHYELIG